MGMSVERYLGIVDLVKSYLLNSFWVWWMELKGSMRCAWLVRWQIVRKINNTEPDIFLIRFLFVFLSLQTYNKSLNTIQIYPLK